MKTDFRISPVGGFSSENTGISSGRESGALVEMSPPFFLGGKAFSFGLTISALVSVRVWRVESCWLCH